MKRISTNSIAKIAVITSLVISLLLALSAGSIESQLNSKIFFIWINIFVRFISLWGLNIILLRKYSNKFTLSIFRVIITTGFLIAVDYFIHITWGTFHAFKGISDTNLFLMRLPSILLFDILIFVIIKQMQAKEAELEVMQEKNELKFKYLESEYLLLKSQINPHFVFNSFNTIKSLIKTNPQAAESYLIRLSDFFRASLQKDKKLSSLKEEIEIINNYLELQRVRFGNTFHFANEIDSAYNKYKIPFFALVTLVENAFKHNICTKEQPLSIIINNEGNEIIIRNNLNLRKVQATTQTGLENLNNRLKIISGKGIAIIKTDTEYIVKFEMIKDENSGNRR